MATAPRAVNRAGQQDTFRRKPMKMPATRRGFAIACALSLVAAHLGVTRADAQQAPANWPTQPIRIIVPSSAGGTTDMLARLAAEWLTPRLGQNVIVENRTGAGGNVGTDAVAKAAPDGHTLGFVSTNNLAINQFLFKSMPYDPVRDLTPVAVVAEAPQVLVVSAQVPVKTLREFIDLAKAKPGALNFGSAGPGSTPHLAGVQFTRLAGLEMTHVPYRGAAPAVVDLAGGQIQMMSVGVAPVAGLMQSGKLRALASATRQRMPNLPDLPTSAEAGLPGFESTTWFGMIAPAKTPRPIVERLNALMQEMVADPRTQQRFDKAYLLPMRMSADAFREMVAREIPIWEKTVRDSGLKMQ
jgi:tripartite-type tricarboxylate transporter receptor subunit TctC